jgi:hypothetical protein
MSDGPEPHAITGRVVRVLSPKLEPTAFIGRVTMMLRKPHGMFCEVAGGGRRMTVPVHQLAFEDGTPLPYYNVHRDRGAEEIDGECQPLDIVDAVKSPSELVEQERAELRVLEGGR